MTHAGTIGGIVIMGAEESKALGSLLDARIDPIEIGKNMMYYSFDLANPSLVQQGGMLNWPAKDPIAQTVRDSCPSLTDDFGLTSTTPRSPGASRT